VLLVLLASTVAVVVFLAMLPGMIAKKRNHPWAQAVTQCFESASQAKPFPDRS
jgi:hypothetical protein